MEAIGANVEGTQVQRGMQGPSFEGGQKKRKGIRGFSLQGDDVNIQDANILTRELARR